MIVFNDNELEIAMVTYNRCEFVKEWIRLCHNETIKRNILLSVYDSSTNFETENFIKEYNKTHERIVYVKVPSETEIGYKPMLPILSSKAKYVWVSGDSRYHDFNEMDEKIFPLIKDGVDSILFCWEKKKNNFGRMYTDKSEFLKESFISATCIGWSIYKTDLFDGLKTDEMWLKACDEKYRRNYGFGWIGYFFEAFTKDDAKASLIKIENKKIFPKNKKQSWAKRFYECWVENLIDLTSKLPDIYTTKYDIPRQTWDDMKLYSHAFCRLARVNGGLSPEIFEKYMGNGMLQKVTDRIRRIKFYAYAPMWQINIIYMICRLLNGLKRVLRKLSII